MLAGNWALADAQAMLQGLNPEEDTRILRQPPRRKAPPSDVPRGQEPLSPAEVPELPPSYETEHRITEPTTYTFSPQSFNTMLLLPPPESRDTRPLYHISVAMNCFIPSSYITTIRRGGNEYGTYVAEFEMGDSDEANTVSIHDHQRLLMGIMGKSGSSKTVGQFTWRGRLGPYIDSRYVILVWNVRGDVKNCSLDEVDEPLLPLASWTSPPRVYGKGKKPPTTLTLLPAAVKYPGLVDQIILSGLIIERQRLSK